MVRSIFAALICILIGVLLYARPQHILRVFALRPEAAGSFLKVSRYAGIAYIVAGTLFLLILAAYGLRILLRPS